MKTYTCILILILSCKAIENVNKVKFKYYDKKKLQAILYIPKGSKKEESIAGGGEGKMVFYYYKDSSLIYLSDARGIITPNNSLIIDQKRVAIKELLPDTSFEGIYKDRYWKEVKKGELYYGYKDVPISKKQHFDNAINTIIIN